MWEEATSRRAEVALFFVADDFHCDEDIGGRRQHRQKEAPGCLPGANSGDVSGRVSGVSRIRVDSRNDLACFRSHDTRDPERHRRMDGSPGIPAATHYDPRLSR